jgi:hypothetical protein
MSEHDAYLDRLYTRLGDLERQLSDLQAGADDAMRRRVADLEAALGVARERMGEMRRAGADLTAEMVRTFGQSVERLSARIGEALALR